MPKRPWRHTCCETAKDFYIVASSIFTSRSQSPDPALTVFPRLQSSYFSSIHRIVETASKLHEPWPGLQRGRKRSAARNSFLSGSQAARRLRMSTRYSRTSVVSRDDPNSRTYVPQKNPEMKRYLNEAVFDEKRKPYEESTNYSPIALSFPWVCFGELLSCTFCNSSLSLTWRL